MSHLLDLHYVEKPWGKTQLPDVFSNLNSRKIGEVWFVPPEKYNKLLVKYIFTSENLSIQTHPSDAQTKIKGIGNQGKEECWLVIDAEPDAKLGVGFNEEIDADRLKHEAQHGDLSALMTWYPVKSGDFFYIPANTVHAIGAGVSIVEIQQNSDITYRLFDYGRHRELHLDEGIEVANRSSYDPINIKHWKSDASQTLVEGPLFRVEAIVGECHPLILSHFGHGSFLLISFSQGFTVLGHPVPPGSCALVSAFEHFSVSPEARGLLVKSL